MASDVDWRRPAFVARVPWEVIALRLKMKHAIDRAKRKAYARCGMRRAVGTVKGNPSREGRSTVENGISSIKDEELALTNLRKSPVLNMITNANRKDSASNATFSGLVIAMASP
jgi:hypothetical protein